MFSILAFSELVDPSQCKLPYSRLPERRQTKNIPHQSTWEPCAITPLFSGEGQDSMSQTPMDRHKSTVITVPIPCCGATCRKQSYRPFALNHHSQHDKASNLLSRSRYSGGHQGFEAASGFACALRMKHCRWRSDSNLTATGCDRCKARGLSVAGTFESVHHSWSYIKSSKEIPLTFPATVSAR
ncbi:hypothetical protein BJX99DRAFT_212850 [Aspergillus californicus]